ncbi:heme-binding beta-barrel domain-containing protein [Halobacteriovorax sp. HLS]|uniref:heme-binding beta-barrel domain-containing protein n=1 Tax=Halobacteriovorax sp. HLS TaxID=2234000 RepID=UPI000FD70528|nr:heme-binding beta-barrel domain-containing protein [Halobacteriovorax sp. HLS]
MSNEKKSLGPLSYLVGLWSSGEDFTGENTAPSPDRDTENTKFKQVYRFEQIDDVENHEQVLGVLRYSTMAWEEGDDDPFHEEVGYFIWDNENKQVMKSFVVPRGVSVLAGGTVSSDANSFEVHAKLGSETYGICSNIFLNEEFKTVAYDLKITKNNENSFSYDEDTQILMKGRDSIFHHTEKNTLTRM